MKVATKVFIRYKDTFLVIRRSAESERAPHTWELAGGLLDAGENLEEGAKREVYEETGLKLNKLTYHDSIRDSSTQDILGVIFIAESTTDEVILSWEHDQYDWVTKRTYHNKNYDKLYTNIIEKIIGKGNKSIGDDMTTTKQDKLIIYTDGGSRGNPGPSASGYVIMDEQEHVIDEGGEYLGITTNNQAEYQAVKLALEKAKVFGNPEIAMRIDSLLVVNQMNGIYKIKNRDLWPIHESIKQLATHFKSVSYTHVRREGNSLADAKVNQVLDAYAESNSS